MANEKMSNTHRNDMKIKKKDSTRNNVTFVSGKEEYNNAIKSSKQGQR